MSACTLTQGISPRRRVLTLSGGAAAVNSSSAAMATLCRSPSAEGVVKPVVMHTHVHTHIHVRTYIQESAKHAYTQTVLHRRIVVVL